MNQFRSFENLFNNQNLHRIHNYSSEFTQRRTERYRSQELKQRNDEILLDLSKGVQHIDVCSCIAIIINFKMLDLHNQFKEVVDTEYKSLQPNSTNRSKINLLDEQISRFNKTYGNEQNYLEAVLSDEELPWLEVSNSFKTKLNQQQIKQLELLIEHYIDSGIQLLSGLSQIIETSNQPTTQKIEVIQLQDEQILLQNSNKLEFKPQNGTSRVKGANNHQEPKLQKIEDLEESGESIEFSEQFGDFNQKQLYLSDEEDEDHQPQRKSVSIMKQQPKQQAHVLEVRQKRRYKKRMTNQEKQKMLPPPKQSHSRQSSHSKKKKALLSPNQVRTLEIELKKPNYNKMQICQKYNICVSTLFRYLRKLKSAGELLPLRASSRQQTIHPNSKIIQIKDKVKQIYDKYPDIYHTQAAQMIAKLYGINVSSHTVSRCMKTIKKMEAERSELEKNKSGVIQERFAFATQISKIPNREKIIFISHGNFNRTLKTANHAFYSRVDQQSIASNSVEEMINFVVAISPHSLIHWKLKQKIFTSKEVADFFREVLSKYSDFTIVLDSSEVHKSAEVREVKQLTLNCLNLPPSSSELDPSQLIFNNFRSLLIQKITPETGGKVILKEANSIFVEMRKKSLDRQFSYCEKYLKVSLQKKPFPSKKD